MEAEIGRDVVHLSVEGGPGVFFGVVFLEFGRRYSEQRGDASSEVGAVLESCPIERATSGSERHLFALLPSVSLHA
jgi:hypothetical protein